MIHIVQAGIADLEKVRKVALKTWPQTFANILSPSQIEYMLDWMYDMESLMQQMLGKQHVFLLAMEGKDCLGFCSYELHVKKQHQTKIQKIYILPESQGKGVGKKLLQTVSEIALQQGDTHLFLNVNKHNQEAISFYLHLGFYEAFKEVIDIGNGFLMDDIVMELKLD